MIRSMTGFGRAALRVDGVALDLEIRSVNHRYLDVRVRVPRLLSSFESELRSRIQERLARGKVDATVTAPGGSAPAPRLEIDEQAVRDYLRVAADLGAREGVPGRLDVASLLALPGVSRFVDPELAAEALQRELLAAADAALAELEGMRVAEGEALDRDMRGRLARIGSLADHIEQRAGIVAETVRERLRRRSEQLAKETGLLDPARLHQEIVFAADRLDVTEEIVRLRSHVEQFGRILDEAAPGNPVGRRLDFLLQEFGREANTIGSKGSDAPIAHEIVELKAEIERLREQVQNVE